LQDDLQVLFSVKAIFEPGHELRSVASHDLLRFWHQAAQAANKKKIAGMSVVRLTVTRSCKAAGNSSAPRQFGWKHSMTLDALHWAKV
jgi:hypothetical protein